MGIVAYYVHVDEAQLSALRERPAIVWNIGDDPRFKGAELVDIDKDWQVVSWLVSAKKRKEQEQETAGMNVSLREDSDRLFDNKAAYEKALNEERKKLGIGSDDPNKLPTDTLLQAIEGRGTEQQRDPKLNFGLGGARVFHPPEVKSIALAFGAVKDADVRANFDRKTMAKFDVGGIGWLEEPDTVLNEFLLPAFRRLAVFYQRAAASGHYVLVIYQ